MAEEKKEEAPAAPASSGKSKLPLILAIVGAVVLLAVVGVAAAVMLSKDTKPQVQEVASDAAKEEDNSHGSAHVEEELAEGEEALGAIFPLESFVVNLANGKYLRVQIKLEFEDRDVPKRFLTRVAPVRDVLVSLLSAKRAEDLMSSEGKENLKHEVKDKVNEALRREDIKNVYFTQFVIQ